MTLAFSTKTRRLLSLAVLAVILANSTSGCKNIFQRTEERRGDEQGPENPVGESPAVGGSGNPPGWRPLSSIVTPNGSFVVGAGILAHQIYDASLRPFNPIGVNILWSYYPREVEESLPVVRSISPNLNAVRVVIDHRFGWQDPGFRGYARLMDKIKTQGMMAILNLMDFTGENDQEAILKAADFWLTMKDFLNHPQYKPYIMINIANEWGGAWGQHQNWHDGIVAAVTRMRMNGLDHVLIVDLAGYAQEAAIATNKQFGPGAVIRSLNRVRPGFGDHVIFSWHMYDEFPTADRVTAAMENLESSISSWSNASWLIGETSRSHPRIQCPNGYLDGIETQCAVDFATLAREARGRSSGLYRGRKWGFFGWAWGFNSVHATPSLAPMDLSTSWQTFVPTAWGRELKTAMDRYAPLGVSQ